VTHFSRRKRIIGVYAPEPLQPPKGGPSTPPPPQTLMCTWCNVEDTNASCEKHIKHTQHSLNCCFLCIQGVTGLHSQQSPWILYTKRNSHCSQFFLMNLQHSSKCPPSSATLSFLQPCLSQSDIEYQYDLPLSDKTGSSPEKLHYDCHNLSL
jgi:hypothetical protein